MNGFLLTIELRPADSVRSPVDSPVVLAQAWCRDEEGVTIEFEQMTGERFKDALASYFASGGEVDARDIEADPRLKRYEVQCQCEEPKPIRDVCARCWMLIAPSARELPG